LPQRDQSVIYRALCGGKCDGGANVRLSRFNPTDRIATGQPDTIAKIATNGAKRRR